MQWRWRRFCTCFGTQLILLKLKMQYGISHLSVVSVRIAADSNSEMVTQLLYGEHFKVLESRKHFSKIRKTFDAAEGWVNNLQFCLIDEERYYKVHSSEKRYSADLVSSVETEKGILIPILMGSSVGNCRFLKHTFDGKSTDQNQEKTGLIPTSLYYLDAPFLTGGLTPFGLDSAGFTQMVYKVNGHALSRTPSQQATQGEALSFIEESEPGDLAFFDNSEGEIDHVGIILEDNYIIHAFGKVRIDRIDHTGIFNTETGSYSHQLRVIKKII